MFFFFQANSGFGVVVLQTHITLRNDNGTFSSPKILKFWGLNNRWLYNHVLNNYITPETRVGDA